MTEYAAAPKRKTFAGGPCRLHRWRQDDVARAALAGGGRMSSIYRTQLVCHALTSISHVVAWYEPCVLATRGIALPEKAPTPHLLTCEIFFALSV